MTVRDRSPPERRARFCCFLSGRLDDDFDAGAEDVGGVGEFELGPAAAEEADEEVAEVFVDFGEGGFELFGHGGVDVFEDGKEVVFLRR